jgi:hypothetical protein
MSDPHGVAVFSGSRVMAGPARVLNLFAYSGGSTLAAALAGAEVCHVDASKGMVDWARKNAALNGLEEKPVRWIVDDVTKFLERELRRERQYDLLILDPPSYGRGAKGEVFKIENDLPPLLALLGKLMSPQPLGVLAILPHAGTHAHLAPSHAAPAIRPQRRQGGARRDAASRRVRRPARAQRQLCLVARLIEHSTFRLRHSTFSQCSASSSAAPSAA